MKLAIFGSYNGTSIGDTAILLGLMHGIAQFAPDTQVTVLTMGPIDLSRDLALTGLVQPPRLVRINVPAPAEWPVVRSMWWRLARLGLPLRTGFNAARCFRQLREQDLLIIGGGNLLMDLFETGVDLVENITRTAQAADTAYIFAGVGAGPIAQAASAERLAACLSSAQRVLVRDESSRALCVETLGRADAACAPDLAFALPARNSAGLRMALAVNVAAIGAPTWPVQDAQCYQRYMDGMARLVLNAATQIQPQCIEIVTTNPAVDLCAARDLAARLAGRTVLPVLLPVLRDVTDLLDAFGRARLAIVTRLHAGITAALAGAPVLPVAYQPKVSSVLLEQRVAYQAIALDELQSPDFDAGATLIQSINHGAGLRPETRTRVLAAIRELLTDSCEARAQA